MGERAPRRRRPPTTIAAMAALVEEALAAGARRLHAPSRTILHRSDARPACPARHAPPDELLAIADAVGAPATACSSSSSDDRPRRARAASWMVDARRAHGRDRHLRARAGRRARPTATATRSADADGWRAEGARRRAAGVVPPDRHAVRAAVVPAPVHHPPDVPRARAICPLAERVGRAAPARGARRAARRGAGAPTNPIALALMSAVGPDVPARRPARLRAGAGDERRPRSPQREGRTPRGGRARPGCSSATARRCCSRRSPATSTATTRRSAR